MHISLSRHAYSTAVRRHAMIRTTCSLLISLLLLAGCSAIHLHATPWRLTTRVASAGGSISSPNREGEQTVSDGSLSRTYLTGEIVPVTVTPDTGHFVSNLTLDGKVLHLNDPAVPFVTTVEGPSPRSVVATFLRIPFVLTATAGANGTVTPLSLQVRQGRQATPVWFVFVPYNGYAVHDITVTGHLPNEDYQLLDAATGRPVTLPAQPKVRVKVVIINVKGSTTLTGTFAVMGAFAGAPRTVLAGSTVALDGSAGAEATAYAWRQLDGPATVTLSGANSARATFRAPAATGTYRFVLTTGGGSGSATTTVFVTDSLAAAARGQCQNCHSQQGVGADRHVFARWSSSVHARPANAVMCYRCHVDTASGGHPGPALASLRRICATCHDIANHPIDIDAKACTSCHDPHSGNP